MSDVVQKLWGFCHTLRHDGIDYGDYEPDSALPARISTESTRQQSQRKLGTSRTRRRKAKRADPKK